MPTMKLGGDRDYTLIKELYYSSRYKIALQLVSWGGLPPLIIKVKMYNEDGDLKRGRIIGLNKYDLEFLKENYESIMAEIERFETKE